MANSFVKNLHLQNTGKIRTKLGIDGSKQFVEIVNVEPITVIMAKNV